jgi:hypothetical protein
MCYPELNMPYMPVSEEKAAARGKTIESLVHEEAELAMVCFPFSSNIACYFVSSRVLSLA